MNQQATGVNFLVAAQGSDHVLILHANTTAVVLEGSLGRTAQQHLHLHAENMSEQVRPVFIDPTSARNLMPLCVPNDAAVMNIDWQICQGPGVDDAQACIGGFTEDLETWRRQVGMLDNKPDSPVLHLSLWCHVSFMRILLKS
jgi:hypothetical protein